MSATSPIEKIGKLNLICEGDQIHLLYSMVLQDVRWEVLCSGSSVKTDVVGYAGAVLIVAEQKHLGSVRLQPQPI